MGNPDDLPQAPQNRRRYGDSDSVGFGGLSENSSATRRICISGTCRNVSARCFAGFLPDQTLSGRARNQNDEKAGRPPGDQRQGPAFDAACILLLRRTGRNSAFDGSVHRRTHDAGNDQTLHGVCLHQGRTGSH